MRVLKDLVSLEDVEDMSDAEEAMELTKDMKYARHRLQCIATAFELLSGQGENLTTLLPIGLHAVPGPSFAFCPSKQCRANRMHPFRKR